MKCPNCGYSNVDDAAFCTSCGSKLPHDDQAVEADSLSQWKTSAGATLAGIIVAMLVSLVLNTMIYMSTTYAQLGMWCVFYCAYMVVDVVYAIVVYLSLFRPSSRFANNIAISFFNGFLGGVIFGCIWNYFLTKRGRRGGIVTTIVFCGLQAFMFAYYIVAAVQYFSM